jgi:serine/threonine-protein kinase
MGALMSAAAELPEGSVTTGDVLAGKYRVARVLGRGGMGVVVEAEHVDLGERVAIKVLHARYCENAEATARFHHEAKAAVRIRGEHSVRLVDVGTAASGAPFIVMELLEGQDLAAMLKIGPLPVEQAVLYILQACEGMAEVHANGIIHRDLKPGNLFVSHRPDGSPLVKVLDFGIAKSMLPMDESEKAVTMTLVALGTPLYMSPEQVRCSKYVDVRTDVWSLGAILYELLAGRPAFGGNTVANITAQVLEASPEPLVSLRRDVSPELDRVVRKTLSKRPELRFHDMASLAHALAPFGGAAGREHAERATRILKGDGRTTGSLPTITDGGVGTTTLMESEIFTTQLFNRRTRKWAVATALVSSIAAAGGAAWMALDARQTAASTVAPAHGWVALAGLHRSAIAKMEARLPSSKHPETVSVDSLPSSAGAAKASAELRRPGGNAAASTTAPKSPRAPRGDAPRPRAVDVDPLSTRK